MTLWRKQGRRGYTQNDFLDCLVAIESLLNQYGISDWRDFFSGINAEIRRSWSPSSTPEVKQAILKRLNRLFGGMGSFNDFGLDHRAGRGLEMKLSANEALKFNMALSDLKNRLYDIIAASKNSKKFGSRSVK